MSPKRKYNDKYKPESENDHQSKKAQLTKAGSQAKKPVHAEPLKSKNNSVPAIHKAIKVEATASPEPIEINLIAAEQDSHQTFANVLEPDISEIRQGDRRYNLRGYNSRWAHPEDLQPKAGRQDSTSKESKSHRAQAAADGRNSKKSLLSKTCDLKERTTSITEESIEKDQAHAEYVAQTGDQQLRASAKKTHQSAVQTEKIRSPHDPHKGLRNPEGGSPILDYPTKFPESSIRDIPMEGAMPDWVRPNASPGRDWIDVVGNCYVGKITTTRAGMGLRPRYHGKVLRYGLTSKMIAQGQHGKEKRKQAIRKAAETISKHGPNTSQRQDQTSGRSKEDEATFCDKGKLAEEVRPVWPPTIKQSVPKPARNSVKKTTRKATRKLKADSETNPAMESTKKVAGEPPKVSSKKPSKDSAKNTPRQLTKESTQKLAKQREKRSSKIEGAAAKIIEELLTRTHPPANGAPAESPPARSYPTARLLLTKLPVNKDKEVTEPKKKNKRIKNAADAGQPVRCAGRLRKKADGEQCNNHFYPDSSEDRFCNKHKNQTD